MESGRLRAQIDHPSSDLTRPWPGQEFRLATRRLQVFVETGRLAVVSSGGYVPVNGPAQRRWFSRNRTLTFSAGRNGSVSCRRSTGGWRSGVRGDVRQVWSLSVPHGLSEVGFDSLGDCTENPCTSVQDAIPLHRNAALSFGIEHVNAMFTEAFGSPLEGIFPLVEQVPFLMGQKTPGALVNAPDMESAVRALFGSRRSSDELVAAVMGTSLGQLNAAVAIRDRVKPFDLVAYLSGPHTYEARWSAGTLRQVLRLADRRSALSLVSQIGSDPRRVHNVAEVARKIGTIPVVHMGSWADLHRDQEMASIRFSGRG